MNADDFLEWYGWVVYTAGFKEATIEKKFPALRKAFKGFKVEYVSKMSTLSPVLKVFKNKGKARSVVKGAKMISEDWFTNLKQCKPKQAVNILDELPGIGPVNKYQLARDIGLADVPKPDIWIIRITKLSKFTNYKKMIGYLSGKFGETYGVVDMILWAFCADKFRNRAELVDYWRSL
jgi:3-methyladenine DNA glycosylase/8-oxoguanine DNA glycosylase